MNIKGNSIFLVILFLLPFSSFADDGNAQFCYEKARYESTYTADSFKNSYRFDDVLNRLFIVSTQNQTVQFSPDSNIIKGANLRSLAHAYLILNDWKKIGCYTSNTSFSSTVALVKITVDSLLAAQFPNLSTQDRIALLYFFPWYQSEAWPIKAVDNSSLSGVLTIAYGQNIANKLEETWNKYGIAFFFKSSLRQNEPAIIQVLSFLEDEIKRFNGSDDQRIRRVLPYLEIVSFYTATGAGNEAGYPNYHGIEMGFPVGLNKPALAWLFWHESGHVFDKQNSGNADYIGSLYCTERDPSLSGDGAYSFQIRNGTLRAFGTYNDFFTSPLSIDDYRREKNLELVSYQCPGASGTKYWSESLRESHYNRVASEQIADDFAHFVMYPGRFFWEKKVIAPQTFQYFQDKLGTNYIDSYAGLFQGTELAAKEIEHAGRIRTAWTNFKLLSEKDKSNFVQNFFESIASQAKDPIQ